MGSGTAGEEGGGWTPTGSLRPPRSCPGRGRQPGDDQLRPMGRRGAAGAARPAPLRCAGHGLAAGRRQPPGCSAPRRRQ